MMVKERVQDYLLEISPKAVCDDCITHKLSLTVRQHANHKTRELEGKLGFDRRSGACSVCGCEKLVIHSLGP